MLDDLLINFVYFILHLTLLPLPLFVTLLPLFIEVTVQIIEVVIDNFIPQFNRILIDVEIIAENKFLNQILNGLTLYVSTLIDHQTKQLTLHNRHLLFRMYHQSIILPIITLPPLYNSRYLIKPLINLVYYLLFNRLLIPFLIVLHCLLLTYLLRQRYIL